MGSGAADIDDSISGIALRRCERSGRPGATLWMEAACTLTLTLPTAPKHPPTHPSS